MGTNQHPNNRPPLNGLDDSFEARLTVSEFHALTDAVTLFYLMLSNNFLAARELFVGDDGGVNHDTYQLLAELVERLRPLQQATPFAREARAMVDELRRRGSL